MAAKTKPLEAKKDLDALFSLEEIKDFIKFVEKVDISEVEITVKDKTLVVSKRPRIIHGAPRQHVTAEEFSGTFAPPAPTARPSAPAAAAPPVAPAARPANLKEIVSPIVGTFYRSSDPKSKAFVQAGDPVSVNQTVCIIEAMKIFNEIKSEVSGVIKEICVENEQPVEYGQALFLVETK